MLATTTKYATGFNYWNMAPHYCLTITGASVVGIVVPRSYSPACVYVRHATLGITLTPCDSV